MKTVIMLLAICLWVNGFSQTKRTTRKQSTTRSKVMIKPNREDTLKAIQPRQTITEKKLNGGDRATTAANDKANSAEPFVTGIHAADDAKKEYDSVAPANPNSINNNTNQAAADAYVASADTVVNVNTVNQGGTTTNSGAVDKSGQAQFGQSNWGSNRSTIGEGQWTVPPPVSSSFTRENAAATNITWSRNSADSNSYSARYKAGTEWIISSYNSTGNRLDRRTEISLQQLPQTVNTYFQKQPSSFQAVYVNRLQVQGKPEVYEIRNSAGTIIYLDMEGREVKF